MYFHELRSLFDDCLAHRGYSVAPVLVGPDCALGLHMYIYIHIYIYQYVYIYTHICTYTYILPSSLHNKISPGDLSKVGSNIGGGFNN